MTTIASHVHMVDTAFVQVLWLQMPNVNAAGLCRHCTCRLLAIRIALQMSESAYLLLARTGESI